MICWCTCMCVEVLLCGSLYVWGVGDCVCVGGWVIVCVCVTEVLRL